MSMASTKLITLVGLTAIAVGFASMAGCAGSKSDDSATGGTTTQGGADTGAGGSTSTAAAGNTSSNGGSTANQSGTTAGGSTSGDCAVTDPVPAEVTCPVVSTVSCNALMSDFSAATYDSATKKWGSSSTLTGGISLYQKVAADAITLAVVDEALNMKATIAAGDYNGIVFWFGPACNDARHFSGISFSIKGTLNAQLQVQMQTSRNYPVDTTNAKGECTNPANPDVMDWGYCKNNYVTVATALTTEAQTLQFAWADFTGGNPIATLQPAELVGIQLQFNCGADADCTPDVTIDDLTFY